MTRWLLTMTLSGGLLFTSGLQAFAEDFTLDPGPAETSASPQPVTKQAIASKAEIRGIVGSGDMRQAETAYLKWASYWKEDDPTLILPIERGLLLQQYKDGDFGVLIGMVRAKDPQALITLRTVLLSNKASLSPANLAAAIRFLGENQDLSALNTTCMALRSEDPMITNTAIVALGNLGDKRVVPDLLALFDAADLQRSVLLGRALAKLGASKQVTRRFLPQLRFPTPEAREKAALVLGSVGEAAGWPTLQRMLVTKQAPAYPLVLTILGALPSPESTAFITAALSGTEEEQMAALEGVHLLGKNTDAKLLEMLRDTKRPATVRVTVIKLVGKRMTWAAVPDLRAIAANFEGEPVSVKAEAMANLLPFGLIEELNTREMLRQRAYVPEDEKDPKVLDDLEEMARAARTALLGYAMQHVAE